MLKETLEAPFDNKDVNFGTTSICTVPVKGDFLTGATLRAILPPIYPIQEGQYVYPVTSSQVGASVYIQMPLTFAIANGTTLSANTLGAHYFTIGSQVTLIGSKTYTASGFLIYNLEGTYTISNIPTSNSFECSTTKAGTCTQGSVTTLAARCGDVVGYFSTQNFNLWLNNISDRTWVINDLSTAGNLLTCTTSTSSGFLPGQRVLLNLPNSGIVNDIFTIVSGADSSFVVSTVVSRFVSLGAYSPNGIDWLESYTAPLGVSIAYGNAYFVTVTSDASSYSTDGYTWSNGTTPSGLWYSVTYGNNGFVAVGTDKTMISSTNGSTWSSSAQTGAWISVTWGGGYYVAIGTNISIYSSNGTVWSTGTPQTGNWISVAYGNGRFVALSSTSIMYSDTNGSTWVLGGTITPSNWSAVTHDGIGLFVAVSSSSPYVMYSTNGNSWTPAPNPQSGSWAAVTYGNGYYVASGGTSVMYSTNADTWVYANAPSTLVWGGLAYGTGNVNAISSITDYVSFAVTPLSIQYNPSSLQFQFFSNTYSNIYFQTVADAAFWGFDARQGFTYPFTNKTIYPPWTLLQSGWVPGFLPPSLSSYDDSVAHKLVKNARILVGKQTIKEFNGEFIELYNDLTVPYENKAILKLLNGTLDQTQSIVNREYYVHFPVENIPLCALTHQHVSIEVEFESYNNLSQNINQGTGDFSNPDSYTSFDYGFNTNTRTTFSYQQYVLFLTFQGTIIVYDTTKTFNYPNSYFNIVSLNGTSGFQQFCVLSQYLYILLQNGQLIRGLIAEFLQGNTSSFVLNNWPLTSYSPEGTMVADSRYIYYSGKNSGNVHLFRYDTQKSFSSSSSYTSFNFTSTINASVTSIYQIIASGSELIMIPNVNGKLYFYNLNAVSFSTNWYSLSYANQGTKITEGTLLGTDIYFVLDGFSLLKYSLDTHVFTNLQTSITIGFGFKNLMAFRNTIYMTSNSYTETCIIQVQIQGNTITYSTNSPVLFDGSTPKIFAHGPRYVYITTQDTSLVQTPMTIQRFDPYIPNKTLTSSFLFSYDSLPKDEKKPQSALIPITQIQHITNMENFELKGPVKELWFTGETGSNVYNYSSLAPQSSLTFNDEGIITTDVGTRTFYNTIQPFETHTTMPIRNMSVTSFEFDPESETPNGTVNFSRIRDQAFDGGATSAWARSINILKIQGGIGGLMFNS
jgi:hypothetical protein